MKPFNLLLLAVALCSFSAYGADTGHFPQKDDILVAEFTAIPLHEATPDPSFGGKAAQIGWIQKGQAVKVLETKQYLSMFGTEIWLEVAKENEPAVRGWVMAGMTGGQSKLVLAHPAAANSPAPASVEKILETQEGEISHSPDSDSFAN